MRLLHALLLLLRALLLMVVQVRERDMPARVLVVIQARLPLHVPLALLLLMLPVMVMWVRVQERVQVQAWVSPALLAAPVRLVALQQPGPSTRQHQGAHCVPATPRGSAGPMAQPWSAASPTATHALPVAPHLPEPLHLRV